VGDLLLINGEGLVDILLGRPNSAVNGLPTTAILQPRIAHTKHWIAAFKENTIFQLPCRPCGWFYDEPEGYISCPAQPVLEDLTRDSHILWIKKLHQI